METEIFVNKILNKYQSKSLTFSELEIGCPLDVYLFDRNILDILPKYIWSLRQLDLAKFSLDYQGGKFLNLKNKNTSRTGRYLIHIQIKQGDKCFWVPIESVKELKNTSKVGWRGPLFEASVIKKAAIKI